MKDIAIFIFGGGLVYGLTVLLSPTMQRIGFWIGYYIISPIITFFMR